MSSTSMSRNQFNAIMKQLAQLGKRPPAGVARARRRPTRQSRRNSRVTRRAPAAVGSVVRPYISTQTRGDTTVLTGCEYFQIQPGAVGVRLALPFSPTLWAGKRTTPLVAQYSSFRPYTITMHWVTASATSVSGTVSVGCLFDDAEIASYTHTSIPSLAGGFTTAAWMNHHMSVRLATHLRTNTYPTQAIGSDDVPLVILVSVDDASISGYLALEFKLAVHNPVLGRSMSPTLTSQSINLTLQAVEGDNVTFTMPTLENLKVGDSLTLCTVSTPALRASTDALTGWQDFWSSVSKFLVKVVSVTQTVIQVVGVISELAALVRTSDAVGSVGSAMLLGYGELDF